MKICSIHIKGYKQFQDTFIDFIHPETGEPVDKVCFIGKNGTGKTTVLRILNNFLKRNSFKENHINSYCLITIKIENNFYCVIHYKTNLFPQKKLGYYHYNEKVIEFFKNFEISKNFDFNQISNFELSGNEIEFLNSQYDKENLDLIIFSPSESTNNQLININDVPQTSLNDALQLFKDFPVYHEVSDQNIQNFWELLIYLIKKRDEEQQFFENKPENLSKTKRELLAEFEKINPKILDKIAILWNKILDKAGLEFDVENANNPIQLTDNLKAYIRIKETKTQIKYNELSTGIRNFIFRVGHIFSLYFNREVKNGFLLLDEPENSLFPDFLFELMETYQEIVYDKNGENNTQIFMTTHNPIIAAQFEPYERIILDWDENGTVKASKGITPAGDDPNDILERDFKLANLMGKKGMAFWEEYLALKQALRKSTNDEEKIELSDKITAIGTSYNF